MCRQEGWRLEHEDPTEANSPIIFKGVVFNEMKGVFVSIYYATFDLLTIINIDKFYCKITQIIQ